MGAAPSRGLCQAELLSVSFHPPAVRIAANGVKGLGGISLACTHTWGRLCWNRCSQSIGRAEGHPLPPAQRCPGLPTPSPPVFGAAHLCEHPSLQPGFVSQRSSKDAGKEQRALRAPHQGHVSRHQPHGKLRGCPAPHPCSQGEKFCNEEAGALRSRKGEAMLSSELGAKRHGGRSMLRGGGGGGEGGEGRVTRIRERSLRRMSGRSCR